MQPTSVPSAARAGWISIAGLASIGAGAVHAAAIGAHSEHPQAVWMFSAVAAFQLGVGVLALVRAHRAIATVLAGGNALLIGGWLGAKANGIGFVEGLGQAEPVQLADALAAALAAVSVVAVLAAELRVGGAVRANGAAVGACGLAVALVAVPAMASVGNHAHEGHAGGRGVAAGAHDHGEPVALASRPYDATIPVDLGGVEGVTPEQQRRAEELVERTLERLPQFADVESLADQGYYSIGDTATGHEHFINWSYVNNDTILDPERPESLVFQTVDGRKALVAAMYMLPEGSTLEDAPDIGGPLTQWHVHNDLCLTDDPVASTLAFGAGRFIVGEDEECPPGSSKRGSMPMIHVWIVPHPCGPFAALEGIAGGQVAEGEEHLCNHVHGGPA